MEMFIYEIMQSHLHAFVKKIEERYNISIPGDIFNGPTKSPRKKPIQKKFKKKIFDFIDSKRITLTVENYSESFVKFKGLIIDKKTMVCVGKLVNDKILKLENEDYWLCKEHNILYSVCS